MTGSPQTSEDGRFRGRLAIPVSVTTLRRDGRDGQTHSDGARARAVAARGGRTTFQNVKEKKRWRETK